MKNIRQTTPVAPSTGEQARTSEQPTAAPQGIGMAVAFDWGLAVQILVMPFVSLFLQQSPSFKPFKLEQPWGTLVMFVISLPFVALCVAFGEGVRRGRRWTRPVQVAINSLGFLGGFATLYSVWQGSKTGIYWSVVPSAILLIFSPLIAWRLSRPATATWFATVSSSDARKRHGGAWIFWIMAWSLVGGILQAISASK